MSNLFHRSNNKAPDFLSRFDSATDMATGLSSFHQGEVFKKVKKAGPFYSKLINALPAPWRKKLYSYGGLLDATSYKDVEKIDAEEISKWIYHSYPNKTYPAVAIGSSNGALSHLYAALNIPWLPQTFLIPVKKEETHSIDKPEETIKWAKEAGPVFLENNPDWHLSQMMDPVQDRIRAGLMAYFRIKKRRLLSWYQKFLTERLEPGGTIFIIDCQLKWPVINVGKNHTFQFGGLGTYQPEEYYHGSKRIRDFLQDVEAKVEKWEISEPESEVPEAEWGFDESLTQDIIQLAKKKGYKVEKISFTHPQDISAPIAEIYRQWYRNNHLLDDRLLVESFTVHSPLLTIQTSSVPYWLFFNSEEAARMMEQYMDKTDPYNEIYMMILSHGKTLGGVAGIGRWESILSRALKSGQFVGMDISKYPLDLGVFTRYTKALSKTIPDRFPVPQLTLQEFNEVYSSYLKGNGVHLSPIVSPGLAG